MRALLHTCLLLFATTAVIAQSGDDNDSDDGYSTIIYWGDSSVSDSDSDSTTTIPTSTSTSDPATERIFLTSPTQGEVLSTSSLTLEWYYNFDYDDDFTIELQPMGATGMDDIVFSTTVNPEYSTTVLPASVLPSIEPGETAAFSVWIYTWDVYGGAGDFVDQVLLYADRRTSTSSSSTTETNSAQTVTRTVEVTPTVASAGGDGNEVESGDGGDGGLSTGAKAGIGAGVGGGVLLVAALVGFILYLRRKRNARQPKTIREISQSTPMSGSTMFGPGSAVGDASSVGKDPRPVSLPLAMSPLSDAGSVRNSAVGSVAVSARIWGERERERFELGS
ncbi:hypothetical protein BDW74DRAFT_32579 [Aspergillus multicolor]|uniref:uncharacterized protein n=1 Tax=Aspergillus multicolor TaxID=41759 RepID=UPI003CCD9D86